MICVACANTKSKEAEVKLEGINLEMFNFVCCLEISEAEESQGICNYCVEELKVSFNFKKRCLEIFANVFENDEEEVDDQPNHINEEDASNFLDSILKQSLCEDDSLNLNDLLIPEVCLGTEGHTVLSALDVSDNRKCRYCFRDFLSKEACQAHMEEHRGDDKPYKCPHEGCDSTFKARKNLKDHFLVHSNERPFPCHYCTQTFKSSSNRSKHERRIHEAERKASKLAAAAAAASGDTPDEDKLADQIEKTQSTSSSSKESTRNISKSIVPPSLVIKKEKEEPVDSSALIVHDDAGNRVFRCEYEGCTSSFRTRSSLKDHQKVHSDERPYGCHYCASAFKSSSNRSKHERGSHPREYQKRKLERERESGRATSDNKNNSIDEPPLKKLKIVVRSPKNNVQSPPTPPVTPKQKIVKHQCRYCDRVFNQPEVRDRHETVHRFFDCGYCSKNFKTQELLKEHTRIHTEQTKFLCPHPTCNEIFQDRRSLREHKLDDHDPEEFICEVEECGKIFPSERALKNHKHKMKHNLSDSYIDCDICLQKFSADKLSEHLKLHI